MPQPEDFWRHMRAIMYQPTAVWVTGTQGSGHRWLTDAYVLLDITESEDLKELADGPYKLTVSKGPEPRDSIPPPDLDAYFRSMDTREWKLAKPTAWSVAEEKDKGNASKAMLWSAGGEPALFGESTWMALKRYYPDAIVEYSFHGNGIFRFSQLDHSAHHGAPHQCDCPPVIFAYAAGIRIPDGDETAAKAIVSAL